MTNQLNKQKTRKKNTQKIVTIEYKIIMKLINKIPIKTITAAATTKQ